MIEYINNKYVFKYDSDVNEYTKFDGKLDWSVFDKIYCIHYLPYKERFQNIKDELKRVGILDSPNFEFYYTVKNDYYRYLLLKDNFKWCNDITQIDYDYNNSKVQFGIDLCNLNKTNINLTVDSYNLLKICEQFEFENVLFIEDDVKFLNDVNHIACVLKSIPRNYDVVNMDPFVFKETHKIKFNRYFVKYNNCTVYNMSCTALSQKAIKQIIQNQEKVLNPFDTYTWKNAENLNKFYTTDSICIQDLAYNTRQNSYLRCSMKYDTVNKELYNA